MRSEAYTGKPTQNMFKEAQARVERQRAVQDASGLRQTVQAEVVAENLTGDPNWDVFLSILQAEIERCEAGEREYTEEMLKPDLDPGLMWAVKIDAIRCRERANALRSAQEIPKVLREDAAKAKEILGKFEID